MAARKDLWVQTPLKESDALSRAAGCRVHLKLELLQPSGSFKSRGIGNYLLARTRSPPDSSPTTTSSPPQKPPHFYCSSGGNAGLACVHAARTLHLPATIVVPFSTKPLMLAKLRAAGAHEVLQDGATWADADAYLREQLLSRESGHERGVYVPPFDDPDIWTGNATMVHEMQSQLGGQKPDAVVCCVGGGGLFNGVMQGLEEVGWADVPVIAVETAGADSLNAALRAGERVTLPGITSRATSLGATRVSEKTWEYAQRPSVRSVVLTDAEAAMGCWRLADDERLMVELASGVCVALCYEGRGRLEEVLGKKLTRESNVVVVVCGGSAVTVEMLAEWRREFGNVEKGMPRNEDVPSAQSAPGADA